MTARTRARIRALEAKVERLSPTSAPGVLTSATSRGVSRRTLRPRTSSTTTATLIPRWG